MQIFIDTANIDEIKEAVSWGIVDGVTTNPSLIKKEMERTKAEKLEDILVPIFEAVGQNKPISIEVLGLTCKEMVDQAAYLARYLFVENRLNKLGNLVIKIPVNPAKSESDKDVLYDGLKAIKKIKEGVSIGGLSDSSGNPTLYTNATLVMTPEQALLAAKAGATYVSPFAGRIDDYIRKEIVKEFMEFNKDAHFPEEGIRGGNDNGIFSGVDLVKKTVKIFKNYNISTKIIAASVRNAQQARELALAGADIATIPFNVLEDMICHPKTFEGVVKFEKDTVEEYADFFKKK